MSTNFMTMQPFGTEYKFVYLYNMANGSADDFCSLADVAGKLYGMSTGILDRKYNPFQDYSVEPEPFCALVEAVFADPVDLLCGWAQYAAAMYEGIKRRRCQWAWDAQRPRPPFRPFYTYTDTPDKWKEAWQEWTLTLPPGEVRFETQEGKTIGHMTGRRATLFVAIARVAAGGTPTGLSEVTEGACRVEAEPFCRLIELVVGTSRDWFCPWAEYAAGMYEVIREQWYAWTWNPSSSPTCGFTPVRHPELAPTLASSGRTIAPDWWTKVSQVSSEKPEPDTTEGG